MPVSVIRSSIAALALCVTFGTAAAGPCDANFQFDGSLADSSGNGFDGQMLGAKGVPAKPVFVEGKFGQALKFDGTSTMRAFVDLSYRTCPQVTYTAWIKAEPLPSQMIMGTSSALHSMISNSGISLRVRGKDLWARDAVMPNAGWMFIAGTWNTETGKTSLHWRSRSIEGEMGTSTQEASAAIFLGALNDSLHFNAKQLVIDEFRIIGRALDHTEIMALQNSQGAGATAVANTAGATAASCSASSDCTAGSYCAVDHACYPNSQRPMESAASSSSASSSSAAGIPGVVSVGPKLPTRNPGGSILPRRGEMPVSIPPALAIAGAASAGLAGRWQTSQMNSGGSLGGSSAYVLTVDLLGPDSNLSGNVWIFASSLFGDIDLDEPLSSVTRSGNTVSFASPSVGNFVGVVSDNGSTITSTVSGQTETMVLSRIAAGAEFQDPAGTGTGDVMAGTWSNFQSTSGDGLSPGAAIAMAFEFTGKDSNLSGTLTAVASLFGGPVEQQESLTNIVKNGQSISFSTSMTGDMFGQISADGTKMTFIMADGTGGTMILEFAKQ